MPIHPFNKAAFLPSRQFLCAEVHKPIFLLVGAGLNLEKVRSTIWIDREADHRSSGPKFLPASCFTLRSRRSCHRSEAAKLYTLIQCHISVWAVGKCKSRKETRNFVRQLATWRRSLNEQASVVSRKHISLYLPAFYPVLLLFAMVSMAQDP